MMGIKNFSFDADLKKVILVTNAPKKGYRPKCGLQYNRGPVYGLVNFDQKYLFYFILIYL
jgi:hypothetical protein